MKRAGCWCALMLMAAQVQAASPVASPGALQELAVLACMRANLPERAQAQDVEFETRDDLGASQRLAGRLHVQRAGTGDADHPLRAMLKLSAPPNLAGAAYLIREKEGVREEGLYVYLPAVRRVRRVSGSFADGGLMGTSFSYADFKLLQNSFSDVSVAYAGEARVQERPAHRLTLTRPRGEVRVWVDRESCVPLRAEFDEYGTVRKRLLVEASALQRSGARWYPAVVQMHDDQEGRHTTLRLREPVAIEGEAQKLFGAETFYR